MLKKMRFTLLAIGIILLLLIGATAKLSCIAPTLAKQPLSLKPPKNGGVYVVAHRGAHNGIPENTLAAYQKAIDLGTDFVEIDLRTTKDGHIVSVHNATVDNYTNDASGKVSDFTLAELKALDIGSRVGPEWKDERIPTFEEILKLCQGKIGLYLDLKDVDLAQTYRLLKEYNMLDQSLWYGTVLHTPIFKKHLKKYPGCIIMPDPLTAKALPLMLNLLHPPVVANVWRSHSKKVVDTCHKAGAIVITDESDPSCWEDALAWGNDGIQTDQPEKLIKYLKEHDKAI